MANHISYQRNRFNETINRVPKKLRPTARFLLYEILFRANWDDRKVATTRDTLDLTRGQVPIGLHPLAEDLGCTVRHLRTVLKWFETDNQVTSRTTNRGTILTIVNYDIYVGSSNENDTQTNKQTTSKRQASDNSKEIELKEEVQEEIFKPLCAPNGDVLKIVDAYKEKIQPGARLTKDAEKKILTRLKTYPLAQIILAIENFSKNTWWKENNGHRGMKWFFNSDDRLEQFANMKPTPASSNNGQHADSTPDVSQSIYKEWTGLR